MGTLDDRCIWGIGYLSDVVKAFNLRKSPQGCHAVVFGLGTMSNGDNHALFNGCTIPICSKAVLSGFNRLGVKCTSGPVILICCFILFVCLNGFVISVYFCSNSLKLLFQPTSIERKFLSLKVQSRDWVAMLTYKLTLTKKFAPRMGVVTFVQVKTQKKSSFIPRLMVTNFSLKVLILVPLAACSL